MSAGIPHLRPTEARVDLGALRRNFDRVREFVGKSVQILTVAKADGYGHGAVRVCKTLQHAGSPCTGVATIEEGIALRLAGVEGSILILGSVWPFANFEAVMDHKLTPTVGSASAFEAIEERSAARKQKTPVHLKVDTGMGRIGLVPASAAALARRIWASRWTDLEGIYSHLSCAEHDGEYTKLQVNAFRMLVDGLSKEGIRPRWVHLANSAGLLDYADSHFNMVRPGLILYGLYPLEEHRRKILLEPAMSLVSRVIFLKKLPPGTRISYGGQFVTRRSTRVATVAAGYADGVNRQLSNQAQVLIRGAHAPVLGAVCMDMFMIDVTDVPGADVGDEVMIFGRQDGEQIPLEDLARAARTVPYELLANISGRVPRVYRPEPDGPP